jgi:hypothetical protein
VLGVIVWVAGIFLSWEIYAKRCHKPLVTDLSHTFPYSIGVYAYIAWLFVHMLRAGRHAR